MRIVTDIEKKTFDRKHEKLADYSLYVLNNKCYLLHTNCVFTNIRELYRKFGFCWQNKYSKESWNKYFFSLEEQLISTIQNEKGPQHQIEALIKRHFHIYEMLQIILDNSDNDLIRCFYHLLQWQFQHHIARDYNEREFLYLLIKYLSAHYVEFDSSIKSDISKNDSKACLYHKLGFELKTSHHYDYVLSLDLHNIAKEQFGWCLFFDHNTQKSFGYTLINDVAKTDQAQWEGMSSVVEDALVKKFQKEESDLLSLLFKETTGAIPLYVKNYDQQFSLSGIS